MVAKNMVTVKTSIGLSQGKLELDPLSKPLCFSSFDVVGPLWISEDSSL